MNNYNLFGTFLILLGYPHSPLGWRYLNVIVRKVPNFLPCHCSNILFQLTKDRIHEWWTRIESLQTVWKKIQECNIMPTLQIQSMIWNRPGSSKTLMVWWLFWTTLLNFLASNNRRPQNGLLQLRHQNFNLRSIAGFIFLSFFWRFSRQQVFRGLSTP